jgi:Na+/H+-dicarboxylate symporter
MGRSATNVIGNSIATCVVAKWEGEYSPGVHEPLEEEVTPAVAQST